MATKLIALGILVLGIGAVATQANAKGTLSCTVIQGPDQPYRGDLSYDFSPDLPANLSIVGGGCGIGDHGSQPTKSYIALHASYALRNRDGKAIGWACGVYPISRSSTPETVMITPFVTACEIKD